MNTEHTIFPEATNNRQEWSFVDRSKWQNWHPQATWNHENADKVQWLGKAGLPCLIHRGGKGNWCAYAGVRPGHPMYGADYKHELVRQIEGHGGIYVTIKSWGPEENGRGICYIEPNGEVQDIWWLAVDFDHLYDVNPTTSEFSGGFATYKDQRYAMREAEYMAHQIADLCPE